MNRFRLFTALIVVVCLTVTAPAAEFYPIDDVIVDAPDGGVDFYPIFQLIDGPGVGFDEDEPHDALEVSANSLWVTQACGFPCSYIDSFGEPIIEFDLGQDRDLNEISVWGYSETNSNGVRDFSLRFATQADGPAGFGTSINYNPTIDDVELFPFERQSFAFTETVSARYVEFTALDNYFEPPGDGTGEEGFPPGGDRVGLGEVAFAIPDEPGLLGDFNRNGQLDVEDINLLSAEVAAGTNDGQFDLDSDNLVDTEDHRIWVKDLKNTWFGDADLDGEFGSADFVKVFATGKYETGQNATWDEGDWNADLQFGSGDLVTAFTDGGFELGPRAVAAIPEPGAALLMTLGMLGIASIARRRR